jgi:hypothetical protein
MEFWASILNLALGTTRSADLSDLLVGRTLPQGNPFVVIRVRRLVDTTAIKFGQKKCHLKILRTL